MLLSESDVIAVACAGTKLEMSWGRRGACAKLKVLCVKGISAASI